MNQTGVALTANLDHQLQHAIELRNVAHAVIVAEHRRKFTRAQGLALLVFYRSLQTHEAIEILMRRQLVEDGRILLRVLVEHVVNSAYMLVIGDDETATDFIKFPAYWRRKLLRDLKAVDEARLRKSVSVEREEEIQKDYDALHPRFKDRMNGEWCVDGPLHKRAAKVDEAVGQQFGQTYAEFRWMVNSEWRFASSNVHGMADTLFEQVSQSNDVTTIEQKYESEDAATALYSANFALALLIPLFDDLLDGKRSQTRYLFEWASSQDMGSGFESCRCLHSFFQVPPTKYGRSIL